MPRPTNLDSSSTALSAFARLRGAGSLVVALAFGVVVRVAEAQRLPQADPERAGFSTAALGALHDTLQQLVADGTIPGAAFLIARGGRIVDVTTVGYADRETRTAVQRNSIFRLASATKIWVSAAVLTLVDDGRIGLDDSLGRYLPEFASMRVYSDSGSTRPAGRAITVRDLLRHTAGTGYGYADPYQAALIERGLMTVGGRFARDWSHPWTLAEWTRRLAAIPLENEPGTAFGYGLSHDILGRVVEAVSGQRLDEFVKRRILDPLGLRDTGFSVDTASRGRLTSFYIVENGRLVRTETGLESPFRDAPRAPSGGGGWDQLGNGGMVTTVDDFARFLLMLLNRGELNRVRILSRAAVAEMLTNQLSGIGSGDSYWPGAGFGYGYAVLYDDVKYDGPGRTGKIWWAGSTNVYFWMDRELELIGVFMTHLVPFGHADVMGRVERLTYGAIADHR